MRPTTRPRCSRCSTPRTDARGIFFPGLSTSSRIERGLDATHQLDGARSELTLDVRELGCADAVLARERATHVEHGLEELAGRRIGASTLAVDARIDEERRVDVAVAEVAEVDHRQLDVSCPARRVCATSSATRSRGTTTSSLTLPICTLATAALTALRAAQRRCA